MLLRVDGCVRRAFCTFWWQDFLFTHFGSQCAPGEANATINISCAVSCSESFRRDHTVRSFCVSKYAQPLGRDKSPLSQARFNHTFQSFVSVCMFHWIFILKQKTKKLWGDILYEEKVAKYMHPSFILIQILDSGVSHSTLPLLT